MSRQTRRIAIAGAAIAAAAATFAGFVAWAGTPETIHWQVDTDRGFSPDVVQFTLTGETADGRTMTSSPASLNVLVGLTAAQLQAGEAQPVAFRVSRDAGEFECRGAAQAGHGSGECRFQGSQSFAQILRQRGAGRARPEDLYRMTVHNVGSDYLEELRRLHYPTPTVDELCRAGEHGVSTKYMRDMALAGFPPGKIDGLILAHDHGVDVAYVSGLRDAGYGSLDAADMVRARLSGVPDQRRRGSWGRRPSPSERNNK